MWMERGEEGRRGRVRDGCNWLVVVAFFWEGRPRFSRFPCGFLEYSLAVVRVFSTPSTLFGKRLVGVVSWVATKFFEFFSSCKWGCK
jgi:hypothetical protein